MNVIFGILMVATVAIYVAAPFFRRELDAESPLPEPITNKDLLERQKREAYAAIKDAEFDHQMGKLSDVDFAALNDKYRLKALGAIEGLEASKGRSTIGTAGLPSQLAFCPSCGLNLPKKANFCPSCGRPIKADRESLQTETSQALSGAVAQTG